VSQTPLDTLPVEDVIDALRTLPIFGGLSDGQLRDFLGHFERVKAPVGWTLFNRGDQAAHLDLLLAGEVTFYEGPKAQLTLAAPAIIGELGVATGLRRNTTGRMTAPGELLRIGREDLKAFLDARSDISIRYHLNLLTVVSDKVKRDDRLIREMRAHIVETQHMMKELRELVLSAPETPISEPIHAALDARIGLNRRANYKIAPPDALPAKIRLPGGAVFPVLALSRESLHLPAEAAGTDGAEGADADAWRGVLVLSSGEIPLDGTISARDDKTVDVTLGLLIDEYAAALEDYLTRAQILDFVV